LRATLSWSAAFRAGQRRRSRNVEKAPKLDLGRYRGKMTIALAKRSTALRRSCGRSSTPIQAEARERAEPNLPMCTCAASLRAA
jgi:hypothetical protein